MKQFIIITVCFLSFVLITSCEELGQTELAQITRAVTHGKTEPARATPAVTRSASSPFMPLRFLNFLNVYRTTYARQSDQPKPIAEYVRRIFEDSRGNLWFGTGAAGVCRYDGDTLVFFSTDEGLSGHLVTGILEDRRGNMWFSTYGGVSRYDGKRFTSFTEKDGLSSNAVWSIHEDRSGTIWAGTVNGLCTYNPEEGEKFTAFALPQADVPNPRPRFSTQLVSSILEDKRGNLWFGTDGVGVCRYDPAAKKTGAKQFTHITMQDGLCDNSIVCMIEDRAGNLWFSSRFGGLSRYTPSAATAAGQRFTNFTAENGDMGNNEVWTMHEDSAGTIWFSSEGYGMYRYNDNGLSHFGKDKGLPIHAVQSIFEDKKGRLWVGGRNGLYFFDGRKFIFFTRDGPLQGGC